ncbi:MAG TPA: gluconate 2-dehydrogenase subunit 3 family protein [Gaiellaceae bacterium]|jgi:gluconate 2-dehydrogenase gamma chain|nr:gluconate 2-dehydrogenase subunit 3 family protein [Gaiellaceae bacterium]
MDTTERRGWSRRDLLRRAGVAGVVATLPAGVAISPAAAALEREQRETFTSTEAATVDAIVARLIPSEGSGAGAAEARVGRYIDLALNGELRSLQGFYSANLAALDEYATSMHGAAFSALPATKQDAVLAALETNMAAGFVPSSSAFFETIREHAIQGMFGDPYYGGNANFAGWDLISYPGIKLHLPAADQRLEATVQPVHKSTYDFAIFRPGGSDHGD